MTRSKKVFAVLAVVFMILLLWASYDISTRTTFPGSRPQLKERIEKQYSQPPVNVEDTVNSERDSLNLRE